MGWRERLADARAGKSAPPPPEAIGTIGTIGNGVFPSKQPPELADDLGEALAADTGGGAPPAYDPPSDDLVARLARAEALLPWQRAEGAGAGDYLTANARLRLARLDPLARGLLVQYAEAQAAKHQGKPT